MPSNNRACFLDRDGVINRSFVKNGKPAPPSNLEEFEILPDVPKALNMLRQEGFLLIIITNQPDVGKKEQSLEIVEAMHQKILKELPIDDIFVCYEVDSPSNTRYKPKPGMLLEAAKKHQIDMSSSYMIGDRWRDVGAGKAAGCSTLFIDYNYCENLKDQPDFICSNLLAAAQEIVAQTKSIANERSRFF